MTKSYCTELDSPVGRLQLIANDHALLGVVWQQENIASLTQLQPVRNPEHEILQATAQQLLEYFQGSRQVFDLPLMVHGTAFQRDVWSALTTIPYGETRSYQDIAQQIGRPKAVRAVGTANGQNPIAIIIPCHRVIGKNGTLVGFGGGLQHKATLLTLEHSTFLTKLS